MFLILLLAIHLSGVAIIWNLTCPARAARLFRRFGLVLASDAASVLRDLATSKASAQKLSSKLRNANLTIKSMKDRVDEVNRELDALAAEEWRKYSLVPPRFDISNDMAVDPRMRIYMTLRMDYMVELNQFAMAVDKPIFLKSVHDRIVAGWTQTISGEVARVLSEIGGAQQKSKSPQGIGAYNG